MQMRYLGKFKVIASVYVSHDQPWNFIAVVSNMDLRVVTLEASLGSVGDKMVV